MPRKKSAYRPTRGIKARGPSVTREMRDRATAPKVRYFRPQRSLKKSGVPLSVEVAPFWTTDPPNVPDGVENSLYNYNLSPDLNSIIGVSITLTGGVLPDGLSIVGLSIVGTPSRIDPFPGIQLTATNSEGSSQSIAFSIDIVGSGGLAPVWDNTPNPPDGQDGVAYAGYDFSVDLNAAINVTYAVASGTLPSGLSLNASGTLSGTPDTVGLESSITISATNVDGSSVSSLFDIDIVVAGESLGPELILNGGFDDASDWTLNTGWSIGSGVASSSGNSGGNGLQQSGVSSDPGGTLYRVTLDIVAGTSLAGNGLRVSFSAGGFVYFNSIGAQSAIITKGTAGSIFFHMDNNLDFNGSIDNVSVKKIL